MYHADPYVDYTGPTCPDCDDKLLEKDEMADFMLVVLENLYGDGEKVLRFNEEGLTNALQELCHYFKIKYPETDLPKVLVSDLTK